MTSKDGAAPAVDPEKFLAYAKQVGIDEKQAKSILNNNSTAAALFAVFEEVRTFATTAATHFQLCFRHRRNSARKFTTSPLARCCRKVLRSQVFGKRAEALLAHTVASALPLETSDIVRAHRATLLNFITTGCDLISARLDFESVSRFAFHSRS